MKPRRYAPPHASGTQNEVGEAPEENWGEGYLPSGSVGKEGYVQILSKKGRRKAMAKERKKKDYSREGLLPPPHHHLVQRKIKYRKRKPTPTIQGVRWS